MKLPKYMIAGIGICLTVGLGIVTLVDVVFRLGLDQITFKAWASAFACVGCMIGIWGRAEDYKQEKNRLQREN